MSMRLYIILTALVITGAIYFTANALPNSRIKVTVKEAPSPDYVDAQVLFLGAYDGKAGSVIFQFKFCGTLVALDIPKETVLAQDTAEADAILTELQRKYCRGN